MVKEKLKTIFDFEAAEDLHRNAVYNFDIKLVKPKGEKFQLLFTDGLSGNLQISDEKNKKYQRIELYFLLPDFWDLTKKNWPAYWLNRIAEVPQKNKTWFGPGDTLPAGNPPKAIDDQLKCSYFILSDPLMPELKLANDPESDPDFSFLAIIPIFAKEFDFKMQSSATPLLKILKEKQIFELIDIYREPVARKKFMGIF